MKHPCALLTMLFFGVTTTACATLSTDFCDQFCDCERCNAREYNECVLYADYREDHYDAYACAPEYEDLVLCEIDFGRCDPNDVWVPDVVTCDREIINLDDCERDNSALR